MFSNLFKYFLLILPFQKQDQRLFHMSSDKQVRNDGMHCACEFAAVFLSVCYRFECLTLLCWCPFFIFFVLLQDFY